MGEREKRDRAGNRGSRQAPAKEHHEVADAIDGARRGVGADNAARAQNNASSARFRRKPARAMGMTITGVDARQAVGTAKDGNP